MTASLEDFEARFTGQRLEGPVMASSPYLTFRPRRVAASVAVALVGVPVLAVVVKGLVEGFTDLTYTIHWLETVPLLMLLVAFVANGWLNERAGETAE